jgi:hypothetical protein
MLPANGMNEIMRIRMIFKFRPGSDTLNQQQGLFIPLYA